MRLIDADALEKTLVEAQAECKKNGGNFRFGVLSNVRANVADTPTIDAIPVEWMESQYYKHMEIKDKYMSAYAIVFAEWNEWKREQEAEV